MRRPVAALMGALLLIGLAGPVSAQSTTAAPAQAQAPIFPNQGSVGFVPPAGMTEIAGAAGFEDRAARAAIIVAEMPVAAFETALRTFSPEVLQSKGVTVESRRDIALPDGNKGVLLTGYQSVGAIALKKWILLAHGKEVAAVITAQMPEESAARYPDAIIEAALSSVVFRAPPSQEELLARLPFVIGKHDGYRILRVLGSSAVLLTGSAADAPAEGMLPYFIVGVARGDVREDDRDSLARRALASVPGVKEIRIERGGDLRINGQSGIEIIARGEDAQSGKPVKIAQWLRFSRGGYVRMVGVMAEDSFNDDFHAMRAMRDSVDLR